MVDHPYPDNGQRSEASPAAGGAGKETERAPVNGTGRENAPSLENGAGWKADPNPEGSAGGRTASASENESEPSISPVPASPPSEAVPTKKEHDGKALASLICAVLAVCLCLFGITAIAGVPLAVAALVLGLVSLRDVYGKAGVALALFALLIPLIYLASLVAVRMVDPAL